MKTLIFYVMLCTNNECTQFEPYTWTVNAKDKASLHLALEECSTLANAYTELKAVKEVDCYFEENKSK